MYYNNSTFLNYISIQVNMNKVHKYWINFFATQYQNVTQVCSCNFYAVPYAPLILKHLSSRIKNRFLRSIAIKVIRKLHYIKLHSTRCLPFAIEMQFWHTRISIITKTSFALYGPIKYEADSGYSSAKLQKYFNYT